MDDLTDTVYGINDGGTMEVFDGTTGSVTAAVALTGGPNQVPPDEVTDTVYVSNDIDSGTVSVIYGALPDAEPDVKSSFSKSTAAPTRRAGKWPSTGSASAPSTPSASVTANRLWPTP